MKKTVLLAIASLTLATAFAASSASPQKAQAQSTVTTTTVANCKHGQCQAIAKSTKKQCKHCVSNPGDKYCYQHK